MTLDEFARQFATASDRRLIETVDHPAENHPLAVEAALTELARRNLDEERSSAIRDELSSERRRYRRVQEQIDMAKSRVAAAAVNAHEIFIDTGRMAPQRRLIIWLMLVLGLSWIGSLPALRWIPYFLNYPADLGFDELEMFLPVIWIPTAMVLLWKGKRAGWFLGAMFACYLFGMALGSLAANLAFSEKPAAPCWPGPMPSVCQSLKMISEHQMHAMT